MIKFLLRTVVFTVIGGIILHYQVNIPFISEYLGKLPGDIIVQTRDGLLYIPVVSGAAVAFIFSLITSVFS